MKEQNKMITEILQTTNDLNGNYCDLYNEYFSQKFGQKIDYVRILDEVESINSLLQRKISDCKSIVINNDPEADEVIKILREYQTLLNTRINVFRFVVKKMYDKAEGIGEKYSIFAYSADTKKMKNLENETRQLGSSLQGVATSFMRKYS